MDMEFSHLDKPSQASEGSATKSLSPMKAIAWFLALLLSTQLLFIGAQSFSPRTAEAASLPHGLVFDDAYGVRSDGVSFMWNYDSHNSYIVNQEGKVTFSSENGYSFWEDIYVEALGGNIVVEKSVGGPYDPDLFGLLDPKTGKMVLDVKYESYDDLIAAAKSKGITSKRLPQSNEPADGRMSTLPNGTAVFYYNGIENIGDRPTPSYLDKTGKQIKIAGYSLGATNPKIEENSMYTIGLFRTNSQGKTMYYVTNSSGKIGAVESSGKVVIPFNYDSYYDAKVGSDFILLKKRNAWEYFDLNSVGYGSKSTSSSSPSSSTNSNSSNTSNNSSTNTTSTNNTTNSSANANTTTTAPVTAIAITGTWKKSGSKWWYQYSAATAKAKGKKYPSNEKVKIAGSYYYFDKSGYMRTGWVKDAGKWYYLDKSGKQTKGWKKVSGKWYYMNNSGVMQTGKITLSKKTYFLNKSGVMQTGWVKNSGKWYYTNGSGVMQTGWKKVSGKWYYMNKSGVMQTGWKKISGKYYYFNNSGVMQSSKWIGNYYVKSNGVMATSEWVGKYYVDKNGKWVKGAKKSSGSSASTSTSNASATKNLIYAAGSNSKVYHTRNCSAAKKIKTPSKISLAQANALGLRKCALC